MPPRIPGPHGLKTFNLCLRPTVRPAAPPAFLPLVQTASLTQKEKAKLRLAKQDPYKWQQSQQRKNKNVSRQTELTEERTIAHGDPIRGLTTPFIESLDSAGQAPLSTPPVDDEGRPLEAPHELPTSPHVLNYLVSQSELDEAIATSYELLMPFRDKTNSMQTEESYEKGLEKHEKDHERAIEALRRITTLNNASSEDRRHANITRIVETFGRHNTDKHLRPKPLSRGHDEREEMIRGGPDTGSSEVQIAILTAKIRVLAQMYESKKGNKDKANKRNLRLLLHRRQALLKYMKRKEKGSERWTHMVEKLGLSPATWEGQIEVR